MTSTEDTTTGQIPNRGAGQIGSPSSLVHWIVLAIILVAYGLRLLELDRQDIWWDEARNIDVALRPIAQIAGAPELDIHPPIYFWLLHGWMNSLGIPNDAEPHQLAFAARYLSVACGTAAVASLFVLARRAKVLYGAVLASAVGALSPFWIAESQEARMYTLSFFLLCVASILLLTVWRDESGTPTIHYGRRVARTVAFSLLCTLALLTHYNAIFIVTAWFVAWVVRALWQTARMQTMLSLVIAGSAIVAFSLGFILPAWRQINGYENPNLQIPSIAAYLFDNIRSYLGGYAFDHSAGSLFGTAWLAIIGLLCVGGLIVFGIHGKQRQWGNGTYDALYLQVFWLIGGLGLYYIAVLDRGAFNVRYSSFVTPALYAVLGLATAQWSRSSVWVLLLMALVLLGPMAPAIHADVYGVENSREDTAGLAGWLKREAKASDVILVDQKYPVGYYYERFAIDAGTNPAGSEAAPARYLFVDINNVDVWLTKWAGNAERVFWVKWFESDTDPRRAVSFLLDQAGERGGEQLFRGYEVDWWDLHPPNRFELAPNLIERSLAFGDSVETVAVSLPNVTDIDGKHLPVVIRWRRVPSGNVNQPLKVRVALYDAMGNRVSQVDSRLLNDRHLLPAEWTFADQPLNVYLLDLPNDIQPGQVEVRLLVYDADSLEPLVHVNQNGNEVGVEPVLGEIELAPSESVVTQ